MRKTLACLLFLFCSVLGWAQAQYTMTYQSGVTDATTFCMTAGNNCWHRFPGANAYDMDIGGDGTFGILQQVSLGLEVWMWDANNYKFVAHPEINYGWDHIAIYDSTHIYLLDAQTPACSGQNRALYFWDGSHAPVQKTGCFINVFVGRNDGTLFAFDINYAVSKSTDGGNTWTRFTGVPTATNIGVAGAGEFCMVSNGVLYAQMLGQSSIAAFSPAPGGTISGCAINSSAPDDVVFWVWTSTNAVKAYNFQSGSWATVPGLTLNKVVAYGKGSTIGRYNANGQPYHFNAYAGMMTGTINGQTNGCPTSTSQCTSQVYHDGSAVMTLPHGHSTSGYQRVLHNVNMNVSGMVWSEFCDPLFGDPSDPECQASSAAASVTCEVSNFNFFSSQGNPPPPPPLIAPHRSIDGRSFDNRILYGAATPIPGGLREVGLCGITANSCGPFTAPTCPYFANQKVVSVTCLGSSGMCDQQVLNDYMLAQCQTRSQANGGAWLILEPYSIVNNETVCPGDNAAVFFRAKIPVLCQ